MAVRKDCQTSGLHRNILTAEAVISLLPCHVSTSAKGQNVTIVTSWRLQADDDVKALDFSSTGREQEEKKPAAVYSAV